MKILITRLNPVSFELAYYLRDEEILIGDTQENFPKNTSSSLSHEILKFCLDRQITHVYPTSEKDLISIKEASILFKEFDINIFIGSLSINYTNSIINDFQSLSTELLRKGYPNKRLAMCREDLKGNYIVIDDQKPDLNDIWTNIKKLSFLHLGKIFNTTSFQSISIFESDTDIQTFDFLIIDHQLHKSTNIPLELKNNLNTLGLMDGYYCLWLNETKILAIKNKLHD